MRGIWWSKVELLHSTLCLLEGEVVFPYFNIRTPFLVPNSKFGKGSHFAIRSIILN